MVFDSIRFFDNDGKSTGFLSNPLKVNELENLTLNQLVLISKRKRGLKKVLVEFLKDFEVKM